MLAQLTHIRNILDRLDLLLEECDDESADQLRCAIKACSRNLAAIESDLRDDESDARDLIETGVSLIERVKLYAAHTDRSKWFEVDTPAPRDDDTIILRTSQILALIQEMPKGASEPPPEVLEAATEAQLIGRHSTVPAPPDTLPEFDQDEPTEVT
jgi:hypothetical protein